MKDYPYFPCYIAEVLLDTAGMSDSEIGQYFIGLIRSWKRMDASSMPEWLSECAEASISKSRRLSENAKARWENSKGNAKAMQLHTNCNAEEKRGDDRDKRRKNIQERCSAFAETTRAQIPEKFPKDQIEKFIAYWTEHGPNDRKARWEKEKSFDVSRRLITWWDRCKDAGPTKAPQGPVYHNVGQWPTDSELRSLSRSEGLSFEYEEVLIEWSRKTSWKESWYTKRHMMNEFKKYIGGAK